MARSTLTPVQLVRDGGVSWGTGVTASANGHVIPNPGPYRLILLLKNADSSSHTAVLRSSSYTGTPSGAANSSLLAPQNTVMAPGTVGDLSVAVAASDTQVIKVDATGRFTQVDGSLYLDFPSTPTSVTIYAFTEPYVVV